MTIKKYGPEGRFAEWGSGINSSGSGGDNGSNSSKSGDTGRDDGVSGGGQ